MRHLRKDERGNRVMTRYDVYIPLPRLHLILFGKVWEKLLIRLKRRMRMNITILEEVNWEEFNAKGD